MTSIKPEPTDTVNFSAMVCLYKNNIASEVFEALNSAFINQTLPPQELVVVFDGPVPDDVTAVIDTFETTVPLIRVVFDQNKGHGHARAAAVAACNHPWIAVIDSDDISLPTRFEKLVAVASAHPDYAVVGGGLTEFYVQDGDMIKGHNMFFPQSPDDVRSYIQSRSPVAQPTCILRVDAVLSVGNYKPWYNNEDYYLWLRLTKAGYEICNIEDVAILLRTNPEFYGRRSGFRYWWNEASLQWFSLCQGTTTFSKFIFGAGVRFVVQVLMTNHFRKLFYSKFLRSS